MKQFTTREIQALAEQAGVNNPVLAVRVVGGRIELHLLGGAVATLPAEHDHDSTTAQQGQNNATIATPTAPLVDLTVPQLRYIAAELGMTGYSRLKRQDLIDRLNAEYTEAQLAEAIRS